MKKLIADLITFVAIIAAATLFHADFTGAHAGLLPIRKPAAPMFPEPDPFSVLPAKGEFLVASRNLADPRFRETVVLLISYGAEGASGLIINRPTNVSLAEMLPYMPGLKERADVVYYGGPVQGNLMLMLIRSAEKPEKPDHLFGNVYLSLSKAMLESMIAANKTEKQFRVYAGYAGWSPGQLDREVSRGDWYIVNADERSIFEKKSSEIWRELIGRASAIHVWNHRPTGRGSSLKNSAVKSL